MINSQRNKMKIDSATFLKFAMVFSFKTFKWPKKVLKNAKIVRRITLQIIIANCTCSLTPVDPISKYFGNGSAHSNIFWKKTADSIILHFHHDSKAKRHNISQIGTYSMLISWFAHDTWDQKFGNENSHFAIEDIWYWVNEVEEKN